MIQYTQGNLLEADVDALVNTVNMVGMELLATADWLIANEHCEAKIESLMEGMKHWTGGSQAAKRKVRLFDARSISIALERLNQVEIQGV